MSVKYMLTSRPPFISDWRKTYHTSLTNALETAWRKHNREWSIDSIAREQKVIISREELMQAFNQMDDLMRELPKRTLPEISEQVIREMERESDEKP
jgi:hypothetical protein